MFSHLYIGIIWFAHIIRIHFIKHTVPHSLFSVIYCMTMWWMLRILPRSTRHSVVLPPHENEHCPPVKARLCLSPSTARSAPRYWIVRLTCKSSLLLCQASFFSATFSVKQATCCASVRWDNYLKHRDTADKIVLKMFYWFNSRKYSYSKTIQTRSILMVVSIFTTKLHELAAKNMILLFKWVMQYWNIFCNGKKTNIVHRGWCKPFTAYWMYILP